jgi:hypothetical protein
MGRQSYKTPQKVLDRLGLQLAPAYMARITNGQVPDARRGHCPPERGSSAPALIMSLQPQIKGCPVSVITAYSIVASKRYCLRCNTDRLLSLSTKLAQTPAANVFGKVGRDGASRTSSDRIPAARNASALTACRGNWAFLDARHDEKTLGESSRFVSSVKLILSMEARSVVPRVASRGLSCANVEQCRRSSLSSQGKSPGLRET